MAKPLNYFDIDRLGEARKRLRIPAGFDGFFFEERFETGEESVTLDSSMTQTVIEKSYVRRNGRCFRIDDFSIFGWQVFSRMGTLVLIFKIDLRAVLLALTELTKITAADSAEAYLAMAEPTSDVIASVGDFAARITSLFGKIPIPGVFGDIADLSDKAEFLDKFGDIAARAEELVRALARLAKLDRTTYARFPHVTMVTSLRRIKLFSHRELVEVECADFILALPEGEALRVEAEDETIIVPEPTPLPKARRGGGKGAFSALGLDVPDDPREPPRKTLMAIREARRQRSAAQARPAAPKEVKRGKRG